MTTLTHFKKLQNPDFIGSYALEPGKDMILTIKSCGLETITGNAGKREEAMVIHFAENVKPMICNVTNAKTIAKIHKTPYIEEWSGLKIQLYSKRVNAFGEEVDALRIREIVPVTAQLDTTKAIAAIYECDSLDQLKQVYSSLSKAEQGHSDVITAKDKRKMELSK